MLIISIMLFIPKYYNKLAEREDLLDSKTDIVTRFLNIQKKMKTE